MLDHARAAELVSGPVLPSRGVLVLIARLAHQMIEPEPTPSQTARGARARSLPTPGARRATVIGAGSFGTALAVLLARGGLRTTLQTRTVEQASALEEQRENTSVPAGRLAARAAAHRGEHRPASTAPTTSSSPSPRAGSAR